MLLNLECRQWFFGVAFGHSAFGLRGYPLDHSLVDLPTVSQVVS